MLPNKPPASISDLPDLRYLNVSGHVPGIYFLCDEGTVVYVGQSRSVIARVLKHIKDGLKAFDCDRVLLIPCPVDELDATELRYIELLKPRYNGSILGEGFVPKKAYGFGRNRPKPTSLPEPGVPARESEAP